jgi:hypothetical protein
VELAASFREVSIFEQPACLSKGRVKRWSCINKDFKEKLADKDCATQEKFVVRAA